MKQKFIITGMSCAACSAHVEKAVRALDGVVSADVNLLAGMMLADFDEAAVTVQNIIDAVVRAGYGASPAETARAVHEKKTEKKKREMTVRLSVSLALLLVLVYFSMGPMLGLPIPKLFEENRLLFAIFQLLLTLPIVWLNRSYYQRGIPTLLRGSPNMDTLVAVGSAAALLYGIYAIIAMAVVPAKQETLGKMLYFEAAAMILTLVTVGKLLETRAKSKTGDAVAALIDLTPKTATVLRDGIETEIPAEQVRIGDTVCVRPGDRIPVDGTILEGAAVIDESALTGESMPVDKTAGDTVAAATVNTSGCFRFRADRVGEDTTLAQIIRIVEDAGGSKAPIARLADKVAGIFVPTVMAIALITAIVWALLGKSFDFCLNKAISVLVISCPCALGLATPVAITVGTGQGAKYGVLIKSAEILETLHKTDTVVFDKTGTLTEGRPSVKAVSPNGCSIDALLAIAAALEQNSEHPVAAAIRSEAEKRNTPEIMAENFTAVPGRGVCGIIDGVTVFGGNLPYLQAQNIPVTAEDAQSRQGNTVIYFGTQTGEYLGSIAVADAPKADAAQTVCDLISSGREVVMLTGDNEATANAVASQMGIKKVIAQVLPQDKDAAIRRLQESGKRVLMVGDGINDSPALMRADVGVAIGTGTDIAVETADVVLMRKDLSAITTALDLSRAVIRNIKENLFWAFFYNTLGIPIAAGVLLPLGIELNPMISAACMSLSSLFVVTNALRLRKFKPKSYATVPKEEKTMEKITLKIDGMMCEHCKMRVEKALQAVAGVESVVVSLDNKSAEITGTASCEALMQAVIDAGYTIL